MKLRISYIIWTQQLWLCHHDNAPLSVKVRAASRSDVYIYSGYRRWYYFYKSRFIRNGLQSGGRQSHVTNHGGCSRQKRLKGTCIYVPKNPFNQLSCVWHWCNSSVVNDTQAKEQHTGRIVEALNQCVSLLPRDKLEHVSSIGLSGQMHGVLFWKAKTGETFATCWRVVMRHLTTSVVEWRNNDSVGFIIAATK